jgi:seryl-tRNA synthetase
MIDPALLRSDLETLRKVVAAKGFEVDLDRLVQLDERRRALTQSVEQAQAERKRVAQELRSADEETRARVAEQRREQAARLDREREELQEVERERTDLLLRVPGLLAADVPPGQSDEDNVELRRWGTPRVEDGLLEHLELLERLGGLLREQAREVAGSRAYALIGPGARLEQAVLRFAWDLVCERGAEPVSPPVLVRGEALTATGFFPNGEEDTYSVPEDDLYLVGTSEVALIALQRGQTFTEEDLPRRFVAVSTCFRREAGAAGRDTRGLYRVHQFQKVEQVSLVRPDLEEQAAEHERLLAVSETILQMLELPYRVALACAGETGFGQYRKNEIETWMPSRGSFGETHSCSSLLDFQARRSTIRYRGSQGGRFVYTLNNTAIASPRILIPLLEAHQDGEVVRIPQALRPYLGGDTELRLDGGE